MGTKINLEEPTNVLLAQFASELGRTSANANQALIAWYRLVELENQRNRHVDEKVAGTPDSDKDNQIEYLTARCNEAAEDLNEWYKLITKEFIEGTAASSREILDKTTGRLRGDYKDLS